MSGRPRILGRLADLHVRIERDWSDRLDQLAHENNVTRSEMARRLLVQVLGQ